MFRHILPSRHLYGNTVVGSPSSSDSNHRRSAPDVLVQEVIARLRSLGVENISEMDGIAGSVVFPLPKGLIQPVSRAQ
ncbi:MAG: hypothetical protein ACYCZJ_11105 [Sulfuriferula sp.]